MIPLPWLIGVGLAGIFGVAAIVYNWDDILKWLHDFLPKVSRMIREFAKKFVTNFEHIAYILAD